MILAEKKMNRGKKKIREIQFTLICNKVKEKAITISKLNSLFFRKKMKSHVFISVGACLEYTSQDVPLKIELTTLQL